MQRNYIKLLHVIVFIYLKDSHQSLIHLLNIFTLIERYNRFHSGSRIVRRSSPVTGGSEGTEKPQWSKHHTYYGDTSSDDMLLLKTR